jgi:hypothetical protein
MNQQSYDETDYRIIAAAAALDGQSIRDWIREAAIKIARERLSQPLGRHEPAQETNN